MSTDPKNLMDNCLEIEGLLSLLIQRGDKVPEHLFSLLENKSENLFKGIKGLKPAEFHPISLPEIQIAESAGFEETEDADVNPDVSSAIKPNTDPEVEKGDIQKIETEECSEDNEIQNQVTADNENKTIEPPVECVNSILPLKFSLNDRYRFRRELFNFSDEEMDEAIQAVSAMNSMDDVEDYFYNDLCWDPENPDVRDFIAVVASRF